MKNLDIDCRQEFLIIFLKVLTYDLPGRHCQTLDID